MLRRSFVVLGLLGALGGGSLTAAGCGSTTHPATAAAPLTASVYHAGTQASSLPVAGETTLRVAPPAADAVGQAWVRSAVGRRQLDRSWALTSARWRKLYTHEQWMTGEIPVPPLYPSSVVIDRLRVLTAFTRGPQLTIEYQILGHDPRQKAKDGTPYDSKTKSFVRLVQEDTGWRVDFYSPYAIILPGKATS